MKNALALLLLFALPHLGEASGKPPNHFGPPVEHPSWSFVGEPQRCRLLQSIPQFGSACFEQKEGQRLQFYMQTERGSAHTSTAEFHSAPPLWKHHAEIRNLGSVKLRRGRNLLSLDADRSQQLLSELELGMSPTLVYADRTRGSRTLAALSPFGFQNAIDEFIQCIGTLESYDFDQDDRHLIQFASASWQIDSPQAASLNELAEQLFSEPDIIEIRLVGHTDAVGHAGNNQVLSRRREQSVLNYLISRGIPREMIVANHRGENQPTANNQNEAGRALNRRVEIQLIRADG